MFTVWLDETMETLGCQLKLAVTALSNANCNIQLVRLIANKNIGYEFICWDQGRSAYHTALTQTKVDQTIAMTFVDYLFKEKANQEIKKILARCYGYFSEVDQCKIFIYTECLLNSIDDSGYYRKVVTHKLTDYIAENMQLNIAGFIQFQLKDYGKFLQKITAMAVEQHVETVEYNEFITVLQAFIAMNPPQMARINIVQEAGGYILLDDNGVSLSAPLSDLIVNETPFDADCLISMLINLAPQEIIFHGKVLDTSVALTQMLENIFVKQVKFCRSCALCDNIGCIDSDWR